MSAAVWAQHPLQQPRMAQSSVERPRHQGRLLTFNTCATPISHALPQPIGRHGRAKEEAVDYIAQQAQRTGLCCSVIRPTAYFKVRELNLCGAGSTH